jgi:hypothetical protein
MDVATEPSVLQVAPKQNRFALTGCFCGLRPKRCVVVIRDGMCDNRERELWHPRNSGNSAGSLDEPVGHDPRCRDSGLLDGDCVVQTAR